MQATTLSDQEIVSSQPPEESQAAKRERQEEKKDEADDLVSGWNVIVWNENAVSAIAWIA